MALTYETSYVSSNANPTPAVVDWGKNNLICYGSCNAVLVWDPHYGSGGKVIEVLSKHTKRVNSVRWIRGVDYESELVSGSTDGTAIVWSLDSNSGCYKPCTLAGHESNVNVVDGLYKDHEKRSVVVATISVDSTLRIWFRPERTGYFEKAQVITLAHGIGLAISLFHTSLNDAIIMAYSTDDSKIHLCCELFSTEHVTFNEVSVLEGHEDWVRGLSFTEDKVKRSLLLASSSQDSLIRLWRLTPNPDTKTFSTSLESVLAGHEGWIYSVHWNPVSLQLLSASIDKTMIIWEFDTQIGLWQEKARLGEVGGNTLGFYGGMFGPTGSSVLAHSYHGAFHLWTWEDGRWVPAVTVGGHFREVVDLGWEPGGQFVVSVSGDQTTRIHAPWSRSDKMTTWHEIARPQVHGYDLSSLAIISRYKFASGAEEKVIRTFQAPANFIDNFKRICDAKDIDSTDKSQVGPKGASVPSLGLSNKAVYEDTNAGDATSKNKDMYLEESHFTAMELTEPPTEETLLQNTLWPEIQKLYGHGYEIYSLAASSDGELLASACKATSTEHAAILLWDTSTWKQIQKLPSHNLTIAQLSFSPNSQYLLSVSRDRRWSLFKRDKSTNLHELIATVDKKTSVHTRIIWCCAWTHDSQHFATGSRDGKVVVWREDSEKQELTERYVPTSECLELKGESVTALAFASNLIDNLYLIAVGFEMGYINLYKWSFEMWTQVLSLDQRVAHHLTVKRLAFRPKSGAAGGKREDVSSLQLASCGSDHSVRIYTLYLHEL